MYNARCLKREFAYNAQWDVSGTLVDLPGVDGFGRAMSNFGRVTKNHVGIQNY